MKREEAAELTGANHKPRQGEAAVWRGSEVWGGGGGGGTPDQRIGWFLQTNEIWHHHEPDRFISEPFADLKTYFTE